MKYEEIYRDWVQAHKQVEAGPGLAEAVMSRIRQAERADRESTSRWSKLLDRISESPWAQAAAVIVAAALGLGRILLTLHVLLFA